MELDPIQISRLSPIQRKEYLEYLGKDISKYNPWNGLDSEQIEIVKKEKINKYSRILENSKITKDDSEIIRIQKEFTTKLSKMTMLERLFYLENLVVIKEFEEEHNYSRKVELLEGFVVKKSVLYSRLGHQLYINEVNSLRKLIPFKHFPRMIAFDEWNLVIYMTYCGETINSQNSQNIPNNWIIQYKTISDILKNTKVNPKDTHFRNICILDSTIHIIDFGLNTIFAKPLKIVLQNLKSKLQILINSKE